MLIGLVKKPKRAKPAENGSIKRNESIRNPFQENFSQMVQVETEEHSQKFISGDKNTAQNLSLRPQISSITNKKESALNMFLHEANEHGKEHIIDMGNQILYIGIIGRSSGLIRRHFDQFRGAEES